MLFIFYGILFLGGMYLVGSAFSAPFLQGPIFVAGILCISAALALPMVAQRAESGPPDRRD
ncbi:MAG: hypothetical protein ABW091_09290 [Microbacterium sp.]